MSARLAIAAPSRLCADAAERIALAGGSVVDVAVAAAAVSMMSEPGVVAPGSGAFVVTAEPHEAPLVYDGYVAVPGVNAGSREPAMITADMGYGGGLTTLVGPGSVAVPGVWAAFGAAHAEHGSLDWHTVLQPAVELAATGVALGTTSATYLEHSHDAVFGHDPVSYAALHPDGRLPVAGTRVWLPGLEASLEAIARNGYEEFYRGDLGHRIGTDLEARGSLLSVADLQRYEVQRRKPIELQVDHFLVATNPAPAVGGAAVAAVLALCPDPADIGAQVNAQRKVFEWRKGGADLSPHRASEVARLLASLPGDPIRSGSTAHVSVVDRHGAACAITLSAGYGSGVIPAGTGLWMNNALGEIELVGDRSHLVVGERLNSNMAPTIARADDGTTVVIGSPGADRITTAIAQTLGRLIQAPEDPAGAVAAPRVHVEITDHVRVAHEPGAEIPPDLDLPSRDFDGIHMFFGGVGLAMRTASGEVLAVSDPRRNGVGVVVA